MERKNLALLCAGVACFWLFALAFGTAQGNGLRQQNPAVQAAADQTPAGAARGGTACLGAALPRRLPDRPADGHYII